MATSPAYHDETTAALAAWTQSVRREAISESAVSALTWHRLDSVGCGVGDLTGRPNDRGVA
jgi:2-methylcitrate dehydratase PrpD